MSILHSLRSRIANRIAPSQEAAGGRRDFFRHAAGAGVAALGVGLLLPDTAWAATEERAARFGIVPGTVVDERGQVKEPQAGVADPFLGTVVAFGFNFAPRGWAMCNGQLLAISSNSALFSLLGTIYGGDGRTTFALPDLRGRTPIQHGAGPGLSDYQMGRRGGSETVTLTTAELPAHSHELSTPVAVVPRANFSSLGNDGATHIVALHTPQTETYTEPTASAGQSRGHENRPPYLAVNYCIALQGVFPSRN